MQDGRTDRLCCLGLVHRSRLYREIKYQTTKKRAPRLTGTRNEDYDFETEEWLLADGALLECVKGGRFEETPDRRYLAARYDEEGASFVLYDQTEHATYDYKEDDAPEVFTALFGADDAGRAGALAAVLSKGERTALIEFRGLWLVETSLLFTPENVLKKEIAPRLMLTATLALPDNCTTLDDPLDALEDPVRRLGVNGFATPYLCRDLTEAIASDDGVCLIVQGVLVYPDCQTSGRRWYYRGRDAAWTTLEDCMRDSSGNLLCRLLSIKSLSATSAVFNIDPNLREVGSGYLQASSHALPFKVAIDKTGATGRCAPWS